MAKECPQCGGLIALAARSCPQCGYEYPREEKPKHEARADSQAVIMASIEPPRWLNVDEVDYALHVKRDTGSRSMRVDYLCGLKTYSEWVPLESERGRGLAMKWWQRAGGSMPLPETIEDALERQEELAWPAQIAVRPEGKYWRIVGHKMPSREEVAA
jgi:DNA repair protein RadD